MKFILLSLLLILGCACITVPQVKPTNLDLQLNEGYVFDVIDTKNWYIKYNHSIPSKSMDNYWCLSPKDYSDLVTWIKESQKTKNKSENPK